MTFYNKITSPIIMTILGKQMFWFQEHDKSGQIFTVLTRRFVEGGCLWIMNHEQFGQICLFLCWQKLSNDFKTSEKEQK
jgi:hypothetical protein